MGQTLQNTPSCDKWPNKSAISKKAAEIDSALVKSALAGNEEAFKSLFNRNRDRVLAICLDYCNGDHAQAHDLSQEIFISAFNTLHQLRNEALFPYWLREIAKNKCISYKRKQNTYTNVLKDYEVIRPGENEREWSAEDLQLIANLVEGIKDAKLRRTIELYYLEGKHSGEIAKIMGISQTAVTTRLNRFRVKFRKRIIQNILKLRASRP